MKHFLRNAYRSESRAIFLAFSTSPTPQRKYLIDRLVRSLIGSGIWSKLDAFYIFAAADSQAALINWKNPGTYNATAVASPTFTADRGFTFDDGSSQYLDLNFNPHTAPTPNYTANSASRFGRLLVNDADAQDVVWGDTATFINNFYVGTGANQVLIRINSEGTNLTTTDATPTGFWAVNRSGASASEFYKNGASVASNAEASSATTNYDFNIVIGRTAGDYGDSQQASHGVGGTLTAAEHAALAFAELAYMRDVGAV